MLISTLFERKRESATSITLICLRLTTLLTSNYPYRDHMLCPMAVWLQCPTDSLFPTIFVDVHPRVKLEASQPINSRTITTLVVHINRHKTDMSILTLTNLSISRYDRPIEL